MPDKIQIGVIGAGMIGDVHIENIRKDGRGEVTWIATRTETTLKKKIKKHKGLKGTTNYQDILKDPSVNSVVIASPPFTHTEIALSALKAGKNILLEKPMVTTYADTKKLVKVVAKYPNLIVLECSCRHARLQPKFRFIKKLLESGEIGEVYHIHHNHLMRTTFIEYNPHGTWALDKTKSGGGPFMDWGVYDLSFHLGLLNDRPQLKTIRSFTKKNLKKFRNPKITQNIEEHGAAYMEFDSGLTYYYERGAGVHCDVDNETRIYGSKGSLRFAFCSWDSPEIEIFYLDKKCREKRSVRKVSFEKHTDDNMELTKHFLDCIVKGEKPMMTVDLAAKHLEILFQILA